MQQHDQWSLASLDVVQPTLAEIGVSLVPARQRAQTLTWAPMITVRSPGNPKWSIGLAALRAMRMNSFLATVRHTEVGVGVIEIRDTK